MVGTPAYAKAPAGLAHPTDSAGNARLGNTTDWRLSDITLRSPVVPSGPSETGATVAALTGPGGGIAGASVPTGQPNARPHPFPAI